MGRVFVQDTVRAIFKRFCGLYVMQSV